MTSTLHILMTRKQLMAFLLSLTLVGTWLFPAGLAYANEQNTFSPASLGSLDSGNSKSFKFIVATDSHLGSGQGNKNSALAFQDISLRHKDASFLIHMGDITETGAQSEYEIFKNHIQGFEFPIFATMGNHESRWQDPQGTKFQQHFGPSSYSFDYGDWHFIILDTTHPEQGSGTLDPSILSWLENDLASLPAQKPVAIFSHHPLLYQTINFQDSDDRFLDIIEKYAVQVVFSGHGHSFIPWKVQGRSLFMSGALMDNTYTLVEVNGKDMAVFAVKPTGQDKKPTHSETLLGQVSAKPSNAFNNPITGLSIEVQEGSLKAKFSLATKASVWFQIDGGYYNELGAKDKGTHEFVVTISAHAPGTHTLRLKAASEDGPYIKAVEFDKNLEQTVIWKKELGSALTGRLLEESPDRVIAGTKDGMVYAISPKTGDILWEYNAGAQWGGAFADDKHLYFGTAASQIHCLDKTSGSVVWKASLDDAQGFVEPPIVSRTSGENMLYIGSSSGLVYALDITRGNQQWAFRAGGAVTNTPSVGLGMVFFGAWDQKFYALNARTGQELWSKTLGRQIYYSPACNSLLYKNVVLTSTAADNYSGGSFLSALDPYSGREIWKGVNGSTFMEPSLPQLSDNASQISRGYVLAPDSSGRITAYYTDNGETNWNLQGNSSLFSGTTNLDGYYVTGGTRGVLAITGNTRFDFKVRDSFLFVDPLVIKLGASDTTNRSGYVVLQGDSKGTLWAISVK